MLAGNSSLRTCVWINENFAKKVGNLRPRNVQIQFENCADNSRPNA